MPLSDRDYMRDEHPPACTCVSCTRRRLNKNRKSSGRFGKPLWRRIIGKIFPWAR